MAVQSYKHHAHQPIPTHVASALWLVAVIASYRAGAFGLDAPGVAALATYSCLFVVIGIGRLYTTALQDRIIMLEMKVRCAEMLPAGDDAKLASLGVKQIVALRFASDDELGALLDRAVREKLPPNDIKAAIKTWRSDLHRT
jgi:hypothetical protein